MNAETVERLELLFARSAIEIFYFMLLAVLPEVSKLVKDFVADIASVLPDLLLLLDVPKAQQDCPFSSKRFIDNLHDGNFCVVLVLLRIVATGALKVSQDNLVQRPHDFF